MSMIKIILIFLIFLYVLKVVSIGIYMFYEIQLAKDINKENTDIVEEFKKLIDIEFMKKAFDIDNNFDINFNNTVPNGAKETFTHTLIVTLGQIDPNLYDNIKKYIASEDVKALNNIIKTYMEHSSDIGATLLNYSEDVATAIQIGLNKVENKFFTLLNFVKTQNYPINIIVDTLLLVCIIFGLIYYVLFHKLFTVIIISLFVLSVLLMVFYRSNAFLIIFTLIAFYVAYFFKLYQIIKYE
jgi:hypothetical protein